MGKTTIVRAALGRAAADGLRVFAARPAAGEAELPYAGLSDLLATVRRDFLAELPGAAAVRDRGGAGSRGVRGGGRLACPFACGAGTASVRGRVGEPRDGCGRRPVVGSTDRRGADVRAAAHGLAAGSVAGRDAHGWEPRGAPVRAGRLGRRAPGRGGRALDDRAGCAAGGASGSAAAAAASGGASARVGGQSDVRARARTPGRLGESGRPFRERCRWPWRNGCGPWIRTRARR